MADEMKVLIVNTFDTSGGAARAAYRLHRAMQSIGVGSQMLVQCKTGDDYTVIGPQTKVQKALCLIRPELDALPVRQYKNKTRTLFSPSWLPFSGVVDKINASDADIVHLHWIAKGMMRIEDIARIKKPVVWSLHDMWAFTGGCHIDSGCGKYVSRCEACPVLGSTRKGDLSYRIFLRKAKTYAKIPFLTIVSPSRWLATCAQNSALLADKCVVTVPNPIDTHTFRPFNKEIARDMLGLPQDKKLVLFGAMDVTSDPNKGFTQLTTVMHTIKSADLELAVFGASRPINAPDFGFPAHYLGYMSNDLSLRILYAAADVMVVPSMQEAFGQTASESMACGTPVVAFGATGLLDIIDHQQNGYLATPYDPTSLAEGIDWVLNHPTPQDLSKNARRKVMEKFEATNVARQYVALYEDVLRKGRSSVC